MSRADQNFCPFIEKAAKLFRARGLQGGKAALTKGEQTRCRILEKASELFWARSFHGVGVAEVAKAAGVNKATIYQYFPSKEALAKEVVLQQRVWTIELIFERAFAEETEAAARLRRIYAIITAHHEEIMSRTGAAPGCPFANLAMELAVQDEGIRREIEASFAQFARYYRRIVEDLSLKNAPTAQQDAAVAALVRNMHGALIASKIEQRPSAIMDALPTALAIASTA